MQNFLSISPKKGKQYVFPDIHGCYKTLKHLVENIVIPTKADTIFFLGDYIDRGPLSYKVIEYIIHLAESGYTVYPLRGNHEENLLQLYHQYDTETIIHVVKKINKTPDLLNASGQIPEQIINFFETLPYYTELPNWWLVHAGFDYRKPNPFTDFSSMINFYVDYQTYDISILNGKRLIHGHKVTKLDEIITMVETNSPIVSLDNGCVYTKPHKIYDISSLGHLCCLELTQNQLFYTRNIDTV